MFLKGWNYLRGYVRIEVRGFSVERFVNLAVHKGVYLWDLTYTPKGVTMKVSIKGFKLLKSCAKKTKCHIKIIDKQGYPFVAHRYRKRKIFAAGFIFFIGILYFLSSFLWLVEVDGAERVKNEDLIAFCSDKGLRTGVFKFKIDKIKLENEIMLAFGDISWINISIKGTKAVIQVTETIPKQELVDRRTPCNIVAKKDGLIVSIATSAGTPLKKSKDVVEKGELLVSGELVVKDDETGIIKEHVHAAAEVWARMYEEINLTVPFTYTEKEYTGQIKKSYKIQILEKNFDLNFLKSSIPFVNYDKITTRDQLRISEDYPLPIIIITDVVKEFVPVEKTRDIEQAKELAGRLVTSRIIREFDFESDIVDKALEFTQLEEGLQVKAMITTLQRIDEESPIDDFEATESETAD